MRNQVKLRCNEMMWLENASSLDDMNQTPENELFVILTNKSDDAPSQPSARFGNPSLRSSPLFNSGSHLKGLQAF